jgi:hypothetical protein
MNNEPIPEWEKYIQLAETDPDLDKVREYVEEAETAMFFRATALLHSNDGHQESEALRQAATRLLRIKNDRLKWPNPLADGN